MIIAQRFLSGFIVMTALAACGVRGDPQPPLTPAELGRGKPTFRRATEEFAFPKVPGVGNPEPTPEPSRDSLPPESEGR